LHNDILSIKKEFNLPPVFIKKSDLGGRYFKVVRKISKGSPMLFTIKNYTVKLARIFIFGLGSDQSYNLIKKDVVRSFKKFISLDNLVLKFTSFSNDKVGSNDIL